MAGVVMLLLFVIGVAVAVDYRRLSQAKSKKQWSIYALLFASGFTALALYALHAPIPDIPLTTSIPYTAR